MDPNARTTPGMPVIGRNRVVVVVENGLVDLEPIFTSDIASVRSTIRQLKLYGHSPTAVPLAKLFHGMDKLGKKGKWLHKQFVSHASNHIESSVLESSAAHVNKEVTVVEPETLIKDPATKREEKKRAAQFKDRVQAKVKFDMATTISKYFFCIHAFFSNCQYIHVSFDASRAGQRQRMFGTIGRSDGYCAWLPPMATFRGKSAKRPKNAIPKSGT